MAVVVIRFFFKISISVSDICRKACHIRIFLYNILKNRKRNIIIIRLLPALTYFCHSADNSSVESRTIKMFVMQTQAYRNLPVTGSVSFDCTLKFRIS